MNLYFKENRPELIVSTLISIIISFPVTGFFHGFITAIGNDGGFSELKGRFFVGIFEAIASSLSFGKPWGDGYESETIRFRIIIFIVFIILTFLIFKFLTRNSKKKKRIEK